MDNVEGKIGLAPPAVSLVSNANTLTNGIPSVFQVLMVRAHEPFGFNVVVRVILARLVALQAHHATELMITTTNVNQLTRQLRPVPRQLQQLRQVQLVAVPVVVLVAGSNVEVKVGQVPLVVNLDCPVSMATTGIRNVNQIQMEKRRRRQQQQQLQLLQK